MKGRIFGIGKVSIVPKDGDEQIDIDSIKHFDANPRLNEDGKLERGCWVPDALNMLEGSFELKVTPKQIQKFRALGKIRLPRKVKKRVKKQMLDHTFFTAMFRKSFTFTNKVYELFAYRGFFLTKKGNPRN